MLHPNQQRFSEPILLPKDIISYRTSESGIRKSIAPDMGRRCTIFVCIVNSACVILNLPSSKLQAMHATIRIWHRLPLLNNTWTSYKLYVCIRLIKAQYVEFEHTIRRVWYGCDTLLVAMDRPIKIKPAWR